jgi:methionine-rich copper-binding protein CopC
VIHKPFPLVTPARLRPRRPLLALLVVLCIATAVVLGSAGRAYAHAALATADPQGGTVVTAAPTAAATLTFGAQTALSPGSP